MKKTYIVTCLFAIITILIVIIAVVTEKPTISSHKINDMAAVDYLPGWTYDGEQYIPPASISQSPTDIIYSGYSLAGNYVYNCSEVPSATKCVGGEKDLLHFLDMAYYTYSTNPEVLKAFDTIITNSSHPPKIYSITPNHGPVGTTIEIDGDGIVGFEGTPDAYIKNSNGEVAMFEGGGMSKDNKYVTTTIKPKLCKEYDDNSGNCKSYMNMQPGVYEIFAEKLLSEKLERVDTSNLIQFTITASSSDLGATSTPISTSTTESKTKSFAYLFDEKREANTSNVVGYFASGAFAWYVPDWLMNNWQMKDYGNQGMIFTPKVRDNVEDFSDITFDVSTSTELTNAENMAYTEEVNIPKDEIITDEVLLNKHNGGMISMQIETDTRIHHIVAYTRDFRRITDMYFMDGNNKTLNIVFESKAEYFPQFSDKIRNLVEGIGELKSPQG